MATRSRMWLVLVTLVCGLGMALFFGLLAGDVEAQEPNWLQWEIHWAKEDTPWDGYWTNVSGSASPDTDIYVSKLGSWLSESYTMSLTSETLTQTFSADNHFSTPYAFYISWRQGEDSWFGSNWYRDVCTPGPEVGVKLDGEDLESGYMWVSNPTTETWKLWLHAHDQVFTHTLNPGDKYVTVPVPGHNLINVVDENGATCSQVWWIRPRLDVVRWVESMTVTAGATVETSVLVNNTGSSVSNVFVTDTWDINMPITVTALTIPWSATQSVITKTDNGLQIWMDNIAMNLAMSVQYELQIPDKYTGVLINCVQTNSTEGGLIETCTKLWVEPKTYKVFLPMVVNH